MNPSFRLLILIVGIFLASAIPLSGQKPPSPESPAAPEKRFSPPEREKGVNPSALPIHRGPKKHKYDKKFWSVWIPTIAIQFADAGMTSYCLQYPDCREGNPIFGRRPSNLKVYSIKAGAVALGLFFSHKLRTEGTKSWLLPPGIMMVTGIAAVIDNGIVLSKIESTTSLQRTSQANRTIGLFPAVYPRGAIGAFNRKTPFMGAGPIRESWSHPWQFSTGANPQLKSILLPSK
jgi:hypothetical protein